MSIHFLRDKAGHKGELNTQHFAWVSSVHSNCQCASECNTCWYAHSSMCVKKTTIVLFIIQIIFTTSSVNMQCCVEQATLHSLTCTAVKATLCVYTLPSDSVNLFHFDQEKPLKSLPTKVHFLCIFTFISNAKPSHN